MTNARDPEKVKIPRMKGEKIIKEPINSDHTWSNLDIEADPTGYLEAQARYLEESEQYREQRNREQDLADFTTTFVDGGGDPKEAEHVWQAIRNDEAAKQAAALSTAALTSERQHISRAL